MITLLIILVSLVVYNFIGYKAAVWNIPNSRKCAIKRWHSESIRRSDMKIGFTTMMLFWPVRLPISVLSKGIEYQLDSSDPKLIEQKKRKEEEAMQELQAASDRDAHRAEQELDRQIRMAEKAQELSKLINLR